MDWGLGYKKDEAEKLYTINDYVSKIFGDHVWSL